MYFQQTVERMRAHERVFAIQDTTYLEHRLFRLKGPEIPSRETHDLRHQCFGSPPWVSDG